MNAVNSLNQNAGKLKWTSRMGRALCALAMLVYPMLLNASPLEFVALLPLFAIYPMYTAIVGWDPFSFIAANAIAQGKIAHVQIAARVSLFVIGISMTAVPLVISHTTGIVDWHAVMLLAAIMPLYAAVVGENPLQALRDSLVALPQSRLGNTGHSGATAISAQDAMNKNAIEKARKRRLSGKQQKAA